VQSTAKRSKTAGISDEAVKAKTGKTWAQWCALLDKAGAKKMTHKDIAGMVGEKFGVGPWWRQMVTVGYEQARGMRVAHETPRGFQISVSKTVRAPIDVLYKAWKDARARSRWLPEKDPTVRKATATKSMRMTWGDGKTSVEVNFYAKGDLKSQVTVQHNKLSREADVARMKRFWSAALGKLKTSLEV